MVAPINSSFEVAFGAFKGFFGVKVGRGWDQRLDGRAGGDLRGGGAAHKVGHLGGGGGGAAGQANTGDGLFVYRPPKEGSLGVVKGESVVRSVEGGDGDGAVGGEEGVGGGGGGIGAVGEGDGVLAGGLKAADK